MAGNPPTIVYNRVEFHRHRNQLLARESSVADFDPYYKWLAIPPAEQPPHYYRLLGLALFEPDLDVISAAADRQMSHIRSYQHSAQSQASQRILNELSSARLTLLRPETKAKYDAELRQRLAAQLPRAKPLKVAAPLDASVPAAVIPLANPQPQLHSIPQPMPRPAAQPAPQPGLIRPQSMPAAARPPVRPDPHPQPTHSVSDSESVEQGPSPQERRRLKQRIAMIRSIAGVVLGGIAGTYIAGLILNFLGAPIPDGARFLPGLGKKVIVADASDKNDPQDAGDQSNSRRNMGIQQGSDNPWQGAGFTPLQLGAGSYVLSWLENGGEFSIGYRPLQGTTASSAGTIPVAKATRIFGADVRKEKATLSLSAKPGGFATFVLPITTQPGCVIEEGRLRLSAALDANPGSVIQAMISPDFDFNTWDKPSNPITVFDAISSKSAMQSVGVGGAFTAPRVREIYFVIGLTVSPQASGGMPLIFTGHQQGDFGEIKVVRADGGGPATVIAANPNEPANSAGETAENLKVDLIGELHKRNYGKPEVANRLQQLKQQVGSSDPRRWLEAASTSSDVPTTCAMLVGAAEQAVAAGDVVLAATAYQRLNTMVATNFAAEETVALDKLYVQQKPGFQPAAYAAWCINVLDRTKKSSQESYRLLARRAYETAIESGDRDLIHRAAFHLAEATQ